jgi:phage antirepressor YoqD-like protein
MIQQIKINDVRHLYKQIKSVLIWTRYYEVLIRKGRRYYITYGMADCEAGVFQFKEKAAQRSEVIGWQEITGKTIDEIMGVADSSKLQCRNDVKNKSK